MKCINSRPLLLYNERTHIGGGQTFIDELLAYSQENKTPIHLIKDTTSIFVFLSTLRNKYSVAILALYKPKFDHIILMILLRLIRVRLVTVVFGIWFLEHRSANPKSPMLHLMILWATQYITFVFSHKIAVFSQYEQRLLLQYFPWFSNKTILIPGGYNKRRFHPVSPLEKRRLRRHIGLPIDKKILLVVSRLEKRKGIDVVIKAFSEIRKKRQDVMLVIVFSIDPFADKDYLFELFSLVKEHSLGNYVRFITGIKKRELYYQTGDLLLHGSKGLETFGLTVLEACACGCPPICFRSSAIGELLNTIDSQLLVPINSPREYIRRVLYYLSQSPQKHASVSKNIVTKARTYTWSKSYDELMRQV